MSVNRVVLIGRLTRDPELRTTNSGKNVVDFSIAVQKRMKPADGSPDADFFRVKAWGQTADYVNSYLQKGRLVAVDGRLETRKWTDQNGTNRESVEVVADNVNGLDRPRDDAGGSYAAVQVPRLLDQSQRHQAKKNTIRSRTSNFELLAFSCQPKERVREIGLAFFVVNETLDSLLIEAKCVRVKFLWQANRGDIEFK
jgi:single-strand DNA-binding protein